jgi:hypothetical protein
MPTTIPVWDDKMNQLPYLNTPFLYMGKKYLPFYLKGKLTVLDIKRQRLSDAMSVRLVGPDSTSAIANTLIKAELATINEVASALENEEDHGFHGSLHLLIKRFSDLRDEMGTSGANDFLESKGVTEAERGVFYSAWNGVIIGQGLADLAGRR